MKDTKILVSRVRKNKIPIGVVAATNVGQIGWSRCSEKDKFDMKKGRLIAIGRANNGSNIEIHPDVLHDVELMTERAERYFK